MNEIEQSIPDNEFVAKCIDLMGNEGVKVVHANWLIEGSPKMLLFDINAEYENYSTWRGDLNRSAGIPNEGHDQETIDAVVFGKLVARFFEKVVCGIYREFSWRVSGKAAGSLRTFTSGYHL